MKLEEQLRRTIRQKGHAYNTEKAYIQKYNQFVQFAKTKYGMYRHPAQLSKSDVQDFLTHLAADQNVAPDTQRVALSAVKFLYENVLELDLGRLDFAPAAKSRKLPVVMTFQEANVFINQFSGLTRLPEQQYGATQVSPSRRLPEKCCFVYLMAARIAGAVHKTVFLELHTVF